MQHIDPGKGRSEGQTGGGSALVRPVSSPPAQPRDATSPGDADSHATPKVAGSLVDGRLSVFGRMLLLVLLPGGVGALTFGLLARRGASVPLSVFAALALAGLGVAYARFEARRLLRPIQMMIAQSDLLAMRYCGELPSRSGFELLALAKSFDAMTSALLTHANTSRQLYEAEAQNALDLQRQYALMQMLRNLASAANNGEPLDSALQSSLREIGTYLDWPVGRLVLVVRKRTGEIESVRSHWYAPDPGRFSAFIDACNASSPQAESTGLIGRAQQSHLSQWVCDLGRMEGWSQGHAALACGLRTGFIVPISAGPDTTAFVEFFADHRIEASAEMLELVEAISVELWNTANRYQSDSSLRAPSTRARRLASVAESMADAIVLSAADGRIEWANGGLTRLVGFSPTQLIGKNIAELLFDADSPSAIECLRQIESGVRVVGLVLASGSGASDVQWYELEIQPLPDDGADATTVFIVVRDVTRQQSTQTALSDALQGAVGKNQARPQFLADLSQCLRAPANQVLGVADLLLATELDEGQRGLIGSLCRSAEAIVGSLDDLLNLSKMESGQLKLESQNFDLCVLVENLVEAMAPRAHAKGIELACRLSTALPRAVRGDAVRLRQILVKLVDNAIRFTERGEVVVTAEAFCEDPTVSRATDGTQVRFVVRDTGVGMRPETLEQLFAMDTSVQLASPRRLGLGLTLCRRMAELMNGNISAASRIGEGSAFQFDVRLAPGDGSMAEPPVDCAKSLTGKRVLIAEDNPTNRQILSEQLTALAMDCAIAENGRQALQMLRIAASSASPFDVAVIDMKMPFMDGVELAEKIRSDAALRALRVVMLTSIAGNERSGGHAHAEGVDAYLAKPVRRQDLINALACALGTPPPALRGAAQAPVAAATGLAPVALPVVSAQRRAESGARPIDSVVPARKVLEKRVLDEIVTRERNGAKGLLQRLVATYESSSTSLLQAADAGLANRDAAGVVQALHSLKLSSAHLGALRFSRSCGELEALARQQHLADAQARWAMLRAEHQSVLLALQALLPLAGAAAQTRLREVER